MMHAMMRRCKMLLTRTSLTPARLALLPLMLLAALFATQANAQVGQQPNRNKRPPATATPPSGNAPSSGMPGNMPGGAQSSDAKADALQQSYPGATELLERAFIAMNLRKPA